MGTDYAEIKRIMKKRLFCSFYEIIIIISECANRKKTYAKARKEYQDMYELFKYIVEIMFVVVAGTAIFTAVKKKKKNNKKNEGE